MIYRVLLLPAFLLGMVIPGLAQETLLPADLFFLDIAGQVWRLAADGSALESVSPAGQVMVDFALAPDGAGIVYRTRNGAVIRAAAGEAPAEIDAGVALPPVMSPGRTIAWSPAGRPIAYATGDGVRVYLPDETRHLDAGGGPFVDLMWSPGGRYLACEVAGGGWTIYQLGPETLTLAGVLEGDNAVAWIPTEALVVAPAGGGLRMVQLGGGMRTLDAAGARISKLLVRDGAVYYFVHTGGPGSPGVLTRLPLTDAAVPETIGTLAFDPSTAHWAAGGSLMTVQGDAGLVLVDPVTGETTPIPNTAGALVWAWSVETPLPPTADHVEALPANLYFLARNAGVVQVWRLDRLSEQPVPLTAASTDVGDFAVSPDGARLAYVVDGRLVVVTIGQPDAVQVAEVPDQGATPAFSANGATLAYAAGGILTVPADGSAEPRGVIGDPGDRRYRYPRWSPDGTWLLIGIEAQESVEWALFSVTGRGPLTFEVRCGGARWISGNKLLCWGAYGAASVTTPGLYMITPGDPAQVETLLDESWSVVDAVYMSKDGVIVFLQGSADAGVMSVQPMRLVPGGTPEVAGVGGLVEAPRLSPDGMMVAGRHDTADDGAGQLLLIRVETGERVGLERPARVWGLVWGE